MKKTLLLFTILMGCLMANAVKPATQKTTDHATKAKAPVYTFKPTEGTGYAVQLKDNKLYLDVSTGVKEPNASYDSKNASLNKMPTKVFFAANGNGWSIYNEAGTYTIIDSKRSWNPSINGTTAYAWTINMVDDSYFTISKSSGNYISMDNPADGQPLYNNMSTGLQFKLVDYETALAEAMNNYSISVIGASQTVSITYDGKSYASSETIQSINTISADDITATEISGMYYTVSIVGSVITITYTATVVEDNPSAICNLLDRIGGTGTAEKFETEVDRSLNSKNDLFVLSSRNGKPFIKGTTISAVTAGIGWYLNHYLNVNIAWNSLNECGDNAYTSLPSLVLPAADETHTCDAQYRYYLNYCTYGYSMATWTWKRWQKEIDWMTLHGVNMPLQIIGLEKVWKDFLLTPISDENSSSKYNYTEEEAENFVPGPAFIGWWGMNNLEGWGGDGSDPAKGMHDDAWYTRQADMASKICSRERELGMQPVLPGFSGMVPTNFTSKTGVATDANGGLWCQFNRPRIIDPTNEQFASIAADYYKALKNVMGESQYYSMDPFHEGGSISSGKYAEAYKAVYDCMEAAKSGSKWVIQQWQWYNYQAISLTAVPAGRLIVLDLFSDGKPAFSTFNGYTPQEAIYCAIPNFGGRSGVMGRLQNLTDNYFSFKQTYPNLKGIGAAPEAIEQTPVTYDLLFELCWMNSTKPDVDAWVQQYATSRYGQDNATAKAAWKTLKNTALSYGADGVNGPVEDVWAAIPNLDCNAVSAWGSTYNNSSAANVNTPAKRHQLIGAVYDLLDQQGTLSGSNYNYDLVEFGSQVFADYAYDLLKDINTAKTNGNTERFNLLKDVFLQLILDVDTLKGTNTNFRLGKWTQEARDAASELLGATTATSDWYEHANARTLISTWGDYANSVNGQLRDYSYRSWQGMMKDVYYPRWKYYFSHNCTNPSANWFYYEWNWAHGMKYAAGDTKKATTPLTTGQTGYRYSPTAQGNTAEVLSALLSKYIVIRNNEDGSKYYDYRDWTTEPTGIQAPHLKKNTNNEIYNLSGVKTSQTRKGVYIINGKKMLVQH